MTRKTMPSGVVVRGVETDDWEDIAAIRDSDNVVYGTLQLPYQSREAMRDYIENLPSDRIMLVAEIEGRVLGQITLRLHAGRRAHVVALEMMIHADFQDKGIGTALMDATLDLAEHWLNASRIELEVFTDNETAIALCKKFDFVVEGTLREYAYRDGQLVDAYLMARVRSD